MSCAPRPNGWPPPRRPEQRAPRRTRSAPPCRGRPRRRARWSRCGRRARRRGPRGRGPNLRVDLFDFDLPPDRIALRPVSPRDSARLLKVERGAISDHGVSDLPALLRRGDVLVFNDTRVIPAQLEGRRGEARIGATLHKRIDLRRWQAFVRNAKRLREGDRIVFPADVAAVAEARHADGSWTLTFAGDEPVE